MKTSNPRFRLAALATLVALIPMIGTAAGPAPPIGPLPVLNFGHSTASQAALPTTNLEVAGTATNIACPPAGTAGTRCQINTKVVSEGVSTPTGPASVFARNEDYNLVRFKATDVYTACGPADECGQVGGKEQTSPEEFRMHFQILEYYHNGPGGTTPTNGRHAIYAIDETDSEGDYVLVDRGSKIQPATDGTFFIDVPFNFVDDGSGTPPPGSMTLGGHFIYAEFLRNDGPTEEPYEEVWVQLTGAEVIGGSNHPTLGWSQSCRWVIVDY
ncbi:MAG: hypothetical protein GY722_26175 [bacterium]|nr:hypothetical protein [bacterium]